MPIRFRCRFCNQLMGIARRKAGQTVQCPTCHAHVVVPATDSAPQPDVPAAPPPPRGADMPPLFERSDFDALLHNPVTESPAPRAVPPPFQPLPPPPPPPPPVGLESFAALTPAPAAPPHPVGLVLSPAQATWLTVAAILLLALAFGIGLLVGHYWMG